MGIPVKLPVFEGPLDLLLHLIDKNKIDIYDIPIVEITNQYMEYIKAMEREDLNTMSEFLLMAATLLDIKCRMLLPKEVNEEGEEEDPRQELVEQLLQYKLYKYMALELKDRELLSDRSMFKKPDIPKEVSEYTPPVDLDELIGDLTLTKLNQIFQEVIRRQTEKIDPVRSKFGKIEKEEVTLPEKMDYISAYTKLHRRFSFRDLLMRQSSKVQVIVTFLAVLEMMKSGRVRAEQEETFGEIMITSTAEEEKSEQKENGGDH
ncbi:segregation and condensation protein A [Sellimonas caecigallum]|uniref:Segregation and condensation protein A n=1 Tax=Sellimonas caecigallum TaxID=2592333 RepID=A0ABS7L668_9FIRM|nr:segregation/condensation protein A [Sellimonas caecigallum]MBY0758564.1 segregation/condensation protein A [Sellimonas caecigallum]